MSSLFKKAKRKKLKKHVYKYFLNKFDIQMNSEMKEYNEFQYKHKPRNEFRLWRYKEHGRYYSGPIDPDYQNTK